MNEATWLPNLVGGTSIWKLAVDLNEAKFFDGRLLVPETEGSESLPVTVRWDLTGLVPLTEARQTHPGDVDAALKSFQSCLERVAKVFATPNTGFDKYKDAFTVPSLDAEGAGTNYFYSPEKKKLFVINWGASPRSMGGKAEYVFGYEDWGKHWGDPATSTAAAAAAIAVAATASPNDPQLATGAEEKKDDEEPKNKKTGDKTRPWWIWPLFGLVLITLLLLALFLLKACEDQKLASTIDASTDGSSDGAIAAAVGTEAGADAGAASGADAGADGAAGGDGNDAGADASAMSDGGGADAGALGDAGRDGGRVADDDDDDVIEGSSGGGSSGGAGGPVIVKTFAGGGQKTSVHRKHYSDEATKWRVSGSTNKVSRTEDREKRFDVWLAPGQTFEGVKVEWQDKAGKWHVH